MPNPTAPTKSFAPGQLVYVHAISRIFPAHVVSHVGNRVNVRAYGKMATTERSVNHVFATREEAVAYNPLGS